MPIECLPEINVQIQKKNDSARYAQYKVTVEKRSIQFRKLQINPIGVFTANISVDVARN